MRKTIVLFATLFVAFTACFAFSGVSKSCGNSTLSHENASIRSKLKEEE